MIYDQLTTTRAKALIINLGFALHDRTSFHLFPSAPSPLILFDPRNKAIPLRSSPVCFCPAPAAPISLFHSSPALFDPLFEPRLSSSTFTRNLREAGAIRTSFFGDAF